MYTPRILISVIDFITWIIEEEYLLETINQLICKYKHYFVQLELWNILIIASDIFGRVKKSISTINLYLTVSKDVWGLVEKNQV